MADCGAHVSVRDLWYEFNGCFLLVLCSADVLLPDSCSRKNLTAGSSRSSLRMRQLTIIWNGSGGAGGLVDDYPQCDAGRTDAVRVEKIPETRTGTQSKRPVSKSKRIDYGYLYMSQCFAKVKCIGPLR